LHSPAASSAWPCCAACCVALTSASSSRWQGAQGEAGGHVSALEITCDRDMHAAETQLQATLTTGASSSVLLLTARSCSSLKMVMAWGPYTNCSCQAANLATYTTPAAHSRKQHHKQQRQSKSESSIVLCQNRSVHASHKRTSPCLSSIKLTKDKHAVTTSLMLRAGCTCFVYAYQAWCQLAAAWMHAT
jgi:hypothetical protein